MSSLATVHQLFGIRRRSGRVVDVAITAAALAGSLAQLAHGGIAGSQNASNDLDWVGGLLVACSTILLLAWRHAPRGVFVISALAAVVLGAAGYPLTLALGPAVALFLLAASRDDEDPWSRRDTATVGVLLVAYLTASGLGKGGLPASELLHSGLAWAAAWFAGDRTRLRHEHIIELARNAERELLLAVAEERARIARDLHDSAGHAISVIAMRAGTARLRRDPVRAQAALEAIEELARKTAGEIDQIVGTLRDDDAVNEPVGLASLATLIERHAAAGLDVRFEQTGTPRELERAVDQAVYRILQEALTNVSRHGAGNAHVAVRFGEAAIDLTVTNSAAAESVMRSNGGHGVIGMRERATLLGGSFDAGSENGSFRVRAQLPYSAARR